MRPTAAGYPEAARLYNPRFDATARPAAIARCSSAQDVAACVRFGAARPDAPLRVRAGGHSFGGWSTGPGLVIDVRPLNSVTVDRAARTARIGAGAALIDVYRGLGDAGVALAAGSCPTVGLGGLALGGGVGVLSRAYGLTCDAIRSAEVVTADGRVREVDARHDPDLLWALSGGGGGFGAVTAFTFDVRPQPVIHRFYLSWTEEHAAAVLVAWSGWMSRADARLWSTCKLLTTAGQGSLRASISGTWIGPAAGLDKQLGPLLQAVAVAPRRRTRRTSDYLSTMLAEAGCDENGSAQQCTSRALTPTSRQPFAATSAYLPSLVLPAAAEAAVAAVRKGLELVGAAQTGMSFDALGGKVGAAPADLNAFAYREALAVIQYTATWPAGSARSVEPFDRHVRALRSAMLPWTGDTAYVNYADPSLPHYGAAYWGNHYPRLQQIKKTYDPGALF